METIESLYASFAGVMPDKVIPLTRSGSNRSYFRLSSAEGPSAIAVKGSDLDENRAFIGICRHFKDCGINVPDLYAVSGDGMSYLQEDLGDNQLYSMLSDARSKGEYGPAEEELLCRTIAALPRIQFMGARGMDYSLCYPDREFNARMVDFDLNYFKYCFLKTSGVEFHEVKLQDDFDALKDDLLRYTGNTFMYRDFQSRNVMIRDGEPYFIDFQGGRRGPVYYDVASFIWQARSKFPPALKEKLVESYLQALAKYEKLDRKYFNARLRKFVLFRMLQVLGAYGFRGRYERRPHFLASIPAAMQQLEELLQTPFKEYPYLNGVLVKLIEGSTPVSRSESPLVVEVNSFSYRKGIPDDASGNGGGYVFDCRGVHNPGKYERFADMTGLDGPVIRFLEEDGEILSFLESVRPIVGAHVKRFMERGFSHLQVNFGCTGGHHRSVYCAESIARHIAGYFGVKVVLTHRELGISKEL